MEREESRCRRYGHPAFVVYVDLDDMKRVNDTHGHAAGDQHLQRAAAVLLQSVRSSDVVARLGGDEFSILGAESDAAACATLIAHVRKNLYEAGIAASLGGASRTAGRNLEQTCRGADAAMYRAKKRPAQAGRTGDAP
ncbi:MAG: GGDEF domain-containing protein [Thiobacillus sp.]|nr:GGDEF domain-containing protein [Thiobacillus sp.]